ncbi:MAG: sodium-dependent transporter [Candidatus Sericytochromatia bacterium]
MATNGNNDRGHWSGPLSFVLAAAGAAIGLGNIWKFPYITGVNGGGAFVLIYLLCIAFVGLPILISEMLIGRHTQRDTVGAYLKLSAGKPGGKAWSVFGWLAVVTCGVLLSYYSIVAGWTIDYFIKAITGTLARTEVEQIPGLFDTLVANPWLNLGYLALFMVMTTTIVAGGIKGGVEKANNILMPALFGLMTILLVYASTQKGFGAALTFLFAPDFSKLTAHGLLEALGHSFFTLSLGMGTVIVYGSYLNKGTSLVKAAISVAFLDTLIALMAGMTIFSIVFSFGLEPASGPSLIFKTMPVLFALLPGGMLLASLFFILLAFAALTSTISMLEVVVAYVVDEDHLSRKTASMIAGGVIFLLGILSALSNSTLSGVKLLGDRNIFDSFDFLVSNVSLPIGGLAAAVFTGWLLSRQAADDEFEATGFEKGSRAFWRFCVRFVAPVAIIIVLLNSVGLIKLT